MQRALLAVNIAIVIGFGWYFLQQQNYEFVAYAGTIALVTAVLFGTLRWTGFSTGIIAGVTVWGILHMMGGSVMTPDGVLYAYRIYPFFDGGGEFYILKMDQVIHAYLYGVVGVMFLHLLRERVGITTHTALIAGVAIFASAGFSTINEIIEFLAAVNLPETGVGGYHNTVLDMIFNLAGATIGVLAAVWCPKRPPHGLSEG
jgi:putative membrane protein